MRGKEPVQVSALAFIAPGAHVPRSDPLPCPPAAASPMRPSLNFLLSSMRCMSDRPPVQPARTPVQGLPADGPVLDRQRTGLCEQLDYNLLFRWFVAIDVLEPSFDHSSFSKKPRSVCDKGRDTAKECSRIRAKRPSRLLSCQEPFPEPHVAIDVAPLVVPLDRNRSKGKETSRILLELPILRQHAFADRQVHRSVLAVFWLYAPSVRQSHQRQGITESRIAGSEVEGSSRGLQLVAASSGAGLRSMWLKGQS